MSTGADWTERIGRHLLPDGSVIVPARIAKLLDDRAQMLSERRIALRASDPQAYVVLSALRLSALGYEQDAFTPMQARDPTSPRLPESCRPDVAARGQKVVQDRRSQTKSDDCLTTTEAATLLGVHARTVRRWAEQQRLPAWQHGRRWFIDRQHIHIAQALAA